MGGSNFAGWKSQNQSVVPYTSGSNGPDAAFELLAKDGRRWIDG